MIETTVMRNITPMHTPARVKKLLSFWTRMVSSASRTASKIGIEWCREGEVRSREGARATLGSRGARRRLLRREAELLGELLAPVVARDLAVAEHDHAAGMRRDVRLVGDHDDGLAGVGEVLEHAHDLFRRLRVEVARRLVGEE